VAGQTGYPGTTRTAGAKTPSVRCPNCGTRNRLRPHSEGVPRCGRCTSLLPWVTTATGSSFDQEIEAAVPVVVDFWAPWCAPCQAIEPVLQNLARHHAGRLKVVEVTVDEEPELAQRWEAMSIPLLVVMRDGETLDRIVGALPARELERRLQPVLEPSAEEATK
jgi:thioredoxin 2